MNPTNLMDFEYKKDVYFYSQARFLVVYETYLLKIQDDLKEGTISYEICLLKLFMYFTLGIFL